MRFIRALPSLALLTGTLASSLDVRNPLDTRDVAEVCAFLDLGLTIDLLGIKITVGVLDVCLCLSAVTSFCSSNSVAREAVALVGLSSVENTLTEMITQNAPKSKCVYPQYGIPECIGINPCGFSCPDGFEPYPPSKPTECICPAPKKNCNGKCIDVKSCPSSKPYGKREKRWEGSGACNARGGGHMACGVFGGAARAWECIDTFNDLESCGGCVLPLTPYTPLGMDCTALPGVADVSCLSGTCVVHRCLPGYTRAKNASHCVRNASTYDSSEDAEDIPASQYGLEHIPLKA